MGLINIYSSWLFACCQAQTIVPVESYLITSEGAEQATAADTASKAATLSKSHSDSDTRMEIGNEEMEQEEPSDNHPLSSVVVCFSKKVAAQESKCIDWKKVYNMFLFSWDIQYRLL